MKKLHLLSALLFALSAFTVSLSTNYTGTHAASAVPQSNSASSDKQERPFRAGRALRIGAAGSATLYGFGVTAIACFFGGQGVADAATGNTKIDSKGMVYGNNFGMPLKTIPVWLGLGTFSGWLTYKAATSCKKQVAGLNRPYTPEDKKKDVATFSIVGAGVTGLAGWKLFSKKA